MTNEDWFGPTTDQGLLDELLTEARRRALGEPAHMPDPAEDCIVELGMIAGIPRMGPWSYSNEQLAIAIKYQLDRMGAKSGLGGL